MEPLATVSDLAARAGVTITDEHKAQAILSMASSVVRAYVGKDFASEPIPDAVADVTVDVAHRVWSNPDGLAGDSIDDAQRRWSDRAAAEGFYLTAANRMVLDPLRVSASNRGLWTLGTTRGGADLDTIYVPTAPAPSGYPFPLYAADDPLVQ